MQPAVQTPCVSAGPASDVSSITTPPSVADDMTTEIESPAAAVTPYTRAHLLGLCGAEQPGVRGTTLQGCTTNSTGTSAGLPRAFSAMTSSVSRYTPLARPTGLKERCSIAGATPSVAMGGGLVVSLSTWQVAIRNSGRARTTAPAARWPRASLRCNPLTFPKGPKLSPEWRQDDRCSNPHTGALGGGDMAPQGGVWLICYNPGPG